MKTKEPVTDSTIFQVASMSKATTAVGIMQLVQSGELALDDDVNNYLNGWKIKENRHNKGKTITLRQLLTHTAGINNGAARQGFPGINRKTAIPSTVDVLEARYKPYFIPVLPRVKSIYPPNTDFHYSGGGYNIIQQVMVETTRQTFPELMDSLIFHPLHMNRTTFDQGIEHTALFPLLASGHRKNGKLLNQKRRLYPEMAAAGLFTTSEDLAKLLIELQLSYLGKSDKLLKQQSTKDMFTKVRMPSGLQWALGWNFHDGPDGQPNAWFHNGSNRGFRSHMMVKPEGGLGFIILTNSNEGKELIGPILQKLFKAYL